MNGTANPTRTENEMTLVNTAADFADAKRPAFQCSQFTYDRERNSLFAEASDLGYGDLVHGFKIVGREQTVAYSLARTQIDGEGETQLWEFNATAPGFPHAIIFND